MARPNGGQVFRRAELRLFFMPTQAPSNPSCADTITILSVSPHKEDHDSLQGIFGHSRWRVLPAANLKIGAALLQCGVSVVVCERDLEGGTWIDLLRQAQTVAEPPTVIVTSRLADDRLWAEALNLGAYDVLAKPFDRTELLRSVRLAWEHWRREANIAPTPAKVLRAAS
jgi:DNA-binding NtrC family response regulator